MSMSLLPNFLRSLLLTVIFSFAVPAVFVIAMLAILFTIGLLPGLGSFSQIGVEQIYGFLAAFGSGRVGEGLLVISLTCGLVGGLFDIYAFYNHHHLDE